MSNPRSMCSGCLSPLLLPSVTRHAKSSWYEGKEGQPGQGLCFYACRHGELAKHVTYEIRNAIGAVCEIIFRCILRAGLARLLYSPKDVGVRGLHQRRGPCAERQLSRCQKWSNNASESYRRTRFGKEPQALAAARGSKHQASRHEASGIKYQRQCTGALSHHASFPPSPSPPSSPSSAGEGSPSTTRASKAGLPGGAEWCL